MGNFVFIVKEIWHTFRDIRYSVNLGRIRAEYRPLLRNDYIKSYLSKLITLLEIKNVTGGGYIRAGRHYDGGYVMLNDFSGKKTAYSFGICDDVSWDSFFAKKQGIKVYMYDHTIQKLPSYNKNFIWKKTGICKEGCERKDLKTLKELLKSNGHSSERNMLLKMDVEGAEWDVLSTIDAGILNQFDQIVMELHGLLDFNKSEKILKSLINLNKNHQLVHVHGSNGSFSIPFQDRNIPNVLEVTYVNRNGRKFEKSGRFFPTHLDEKNNSSLPDILLGYWESD